MTKAITLGGNASRQDDDAAAPPFSGCPSPFAMQDGRARLRHPTIPGACDPAQWDMAREAGDAAGCRYSQKRPDWTRADALALGRDELPVSALVGAMERHQRRPRRIFSPYGPCPAVPAALHQILGDAEITAWVPYHHVTADLPNREMMPDQGPRLSHQKQSHPNRDFRLARKADLIYLSANSELSQVSNDLPLLIRRCREALSDRGVLVLFVSARGSFLPRRALDQFCRDSLETIDLDHGRVFVLTAAGGKRDRLSRDLERALCKYLVKDPEARTATVLRALSRESSHRLSKKVRRAAKAAGHGATWYQRERAAKKLAGLATPILRPEVTRRLRSFFRLEYEVTEPVLVPIPKGGLSTRARRVREERLRMDKRVELDAKPWEPETRIVSKFEFMDRILLGVLNELLTRLVEPKLSSVAIGGRPGTRFRRSISSIRTILKSNLCFCASADIKSCFDQIPHDRLSSVMAKHLPPRWASALERMTRGLMKDGRGLGQGNPVSMTLVNLYLHELADQLLAGLRVKAYRYVDDWALLAEDRGTLRHAVGELKRRMKEAGLRLNETKSRLQPRQGSLHFLGLEFRKWGAKPEEGVMTAFRSLVEDRKPPYGSMIYYRRVLTRDEFHATFDEVFLDDTVYECCAAYDAHAVSGGSPLFPRSKSSRSRAAHVGLAPESPELAWGPPSGARSDALLTIFPELDAWAPISLGSTVGLMSARSDVVSRFIVREILKRSGAEPGEILWIDPGLQWASEKREQMWRDRFGTGDVGIDGPVTAEIVGPESFDHSVLGPLYRVGIDDFVTDFTPLILDDGIEQPADVRGLRACCVTAVVRRGSKAGRRDDRWRRDVLDPIRRGKHRVIVFRIATVLGEAGLRTPASVINEGIRTIESAMRLCERKHGFRPTLFWIGDMSGWNDPNDGLNGLRPAGGKFLVNHTDLLIRIDDSTATAPPRKGGVGIFRREPEFRSVHYNFRLTARRIGGERQTFHASYCAFRKANAQVPAGCLAMGEWDEAGRAMFGMGWSADPPAKIRKLSPLRRQRLLETLTMRNEVRSTIRGTFRDLEAVPGLCAEPRRSPSGPRSTRLIAESTQDPSRGSSIEAVGLDRLVHLTGLAKTPASGSGRVSGDLCSEMLRVEVKVTEKRKRVLRLLELQKIVSSAAQEGRVAAHITSFVQDDVHYCYVESGPSAAADEDIISGRGLALRVGEEPPLSFRFDSWPVTWRRVHLVDLLDLDRELQHENGVIPYETSALLLEDDVVAS